MTTPVPQVVSLIFLRTFLSSPEDGRIEPNEGRMRWDQQCRYLVTESANITNISDNTFITAVALNEIVVRS